MLRGLLERAKVLFAIVDLTSVNTALLFDRCASRAKPTQETRRLVGATRPPDRCGERMGRKGKVAAADEDEELFEVERTLKTEEVKKRHTDGGACGAVA
eukprot:scaffold9652_cov152-Isochrysis_galbana.AAC.1